jgi:ParB family chromosome partitioning protein
MDSTLLANDLFSAGSGVRISPDIVAVRAEDVEATHPCLFWACPPDEAFARSIAEQGQLAPVLVDLRSGRPSLVCGFKRVTVLRGLGRPVLARAVEADEMERGLAYLADNSGRALDEGLRLAALRYFAPLLPRERLALEIGPRLGLAPRSRELGLLLGFLDLPAAFGAHLTAGRLPLAVAAVLARLAPEDLAAVEPFFRTLAWSRSAAVQFVTWLFEAGRAADRPLSALLERDGFAAILAANLSPRDAIERLLARARGLRYPTLAGLERRFSELGRRLTRGTPWRVEPVQHFESRAVELRARVGTARQLAAAAKSLAALRGLGLWDELWNLGEAGDDGEAGRDPPEAIR